MCSQHWDSIRYVREPTSMYLVLRMFQKATIHFENGKNIVINAPQNSETNYYIQDMKVNGQEYAKNYITYSTLQNGGTIDYVMGDKPNKNRGIAPEDAPYSFSKELKK